VKAHYSDERATVYHGDCIEVMRSLPDNSVDSVVTDPPYGLEFMGKDWDSPWKRSGDVVADPASVGGFQDGAGGNPYSRSRIRIGAGGEASYGFQLWVTDFATEALRVLKPGAHLLAFGGTRTWHRLAVGIEDAGFEIRDSIAWMYGSGFPKSLDVSKAISKHSTIGLCSCSVPEPVVKLRHEKDIQRRNKATFGNDDGQGTRGVGGCEGTASHAMETPRESSDVSVNNSCAEISAVRNVREGNAETGKILQEIGEPFLLPQLFESVSKEKGHGDVEIWAGLERGARESSPARQGLPELFNDGGQGAGSSSLSALSVRGQKHDGQSDFTLSELSPQSRSQEQQNPFSGQDNREDSKGLPNDDYSCAQCGGVRKDIGGTALKPAHEPIVVARKPLIGTVAENVLTHGTGALNIDGSRIGTQEMFKTTSNGEVISGNDSMTGANYKRIPNGTASGRWPANVILDESQAAELDRQSGVSSTKQPAGVVEDNREGSDSIGAFSGSYKRQGLTDSGGASRFFYVAKANKRERPRDGDTAHPTVKPLALMRYLCTLVTPPGGTILEPFAGSGTTVQAALMEGFNVIGIEMTDEYLPLIVERIERYGEMLF